MCIQKPFFNCWVIWVFILQNATTYTVSTKGEGRFQFALVGWPWSKQKVRSTPQLYKELYICTMYKDASGRCFSYAVIGTGVGARGGLRATSPLARVLPRRAAGSLLFFNRRKPLCVSDRAIPHGKRPLFSEGWDMNGDTWKLLNVSLEIFGQGW